MSTVTGTVLINKLKHLPYVTTSANRLSTQYVAKQTDLSPPSRPYSNQEVRKTPHFKLKTLSRVKRLRPNLSSWLTSTLKRLRYVQCRRKGHTINTVSRSQNSDPLKVSSFLKTLAPRNIKNSYTTRLATKALHFRAKTMKHSRAYESGSGTRFAMTFKKKTIKYPSTEKLLTSKEKLTFTFTYRQLGHLTTQILSTVYTNFSLMAGDIVKTSNVLYPLPTTPTTNLLTYTNSIIDLLFTNNPKTQRLQRINYSYEPSSTLVTDSQKLYDTTPVYAEKTTNLLPLTSTLNSTYSLQTLNC